MNSNRQIKFILTLLAFLIGLAAPVWAGQASEDLFQILDITENEQNITTAHFPRPISKIAENVTVINASDIARMNAHTLADVLQTIPGIQLDQVQTPGAWSGFTLYNSTAKHINLLIDGVPQNFIAADDSAEPYMIPVQIIDRVEIIKGVASVAWGQALGGVINVITKSPDQYKSLSGAGSASTGEHNTSDLRVELSGTLQPFGYFLSGGNIHSSGLVTGTRVNFNHLFGKFSYNLPGRRNLTLGLDVRDATRGLEDIPPPTDYRDSATSRYGSGSLAFSSPLGDYLSLEMIGWLGQRQQSTQWGAFTTTDLFRDYKLKEDFSGARTRLLWGDSKANLVAGLEYDHSSNSATDPTTAPLNYNLSLNHWGAFLNGSYELGSFTILPGVRYDSFDYINNATNYSLGATWRLSEAALLRAYAAKGYSLPAVDPSYTDKNSLQDIWTVQSGFETTVIPYLWLKGTCFYSDLSNIQDVASNSNRGQIKQGFEVEAKSTSLYDFSLSGGYTFTNARDKATGEKLQTDVGKSNPPHGVKAALNYNNNLLGLQGTLFGNYVWWNSVNPDTQDKSVIWDLHLRKQLFPGKESSPVLFFSVRNIFNGSQFQREIRPNTPRWIEGGVRFSF